MPWLSHRPHPILTERGRDDGTGSSGSWLLSLDAPFAGTSGPGRTHRRRRTPGAARLGVARSRRETVRHTIRRPVRIPSTLCASRPEVREEPTCDLQVRVRRLWWRRLRAIRTSPRCETGSASSRLAWPDIVAAGIAPPHSRLTRRACTVCRGVPADRRPARLCRPAVEYAGYGHRGQPMFARRHRRSRVRRGVRRRHRRPSSNSTSSTTVRSSNPSSRRHTLEPRTPSSSPRDQPWTAGNVGGRRRVATEAAPVDHHGDGVGLIRPMMHQIGGGAPRSGVMRCWATTVVGG